MNTQANPNALSGPVSDVEALCASVGVTVSALSYISFDLCEIQDHGPIPQGLRDALISLIERNEVLALQLIDLAKHATMMEKINRELID